jgi:hypothetical protein
MTDRLLASVQACVVAEQAKALQIELGCGEKWQIDAVAGERLNRLSDLQRLIEQPVRLFFDQFIPKDSHACAERTEE